MTLASVCGVAATVLAQPGATGAGQPAGQPVGQPGTVMPAQPELPPPPPVRQASVFKWSDADLEKVGSMLAGTWKTTKDVPLGDGSGASAVVMNVAPVVIAGVPDALVAEISRADSTHAPHRIAVYQVYKHGGKIRLRTYDLHKNSDGTDSVAAKALVGASYIPQWFPSDFSRAWLVGTLDLELTADANGFKGKTLYPYPTAIGGAIEMTSEISVTKDGMTTLDRGTDAAGKVVWGDKDAAVTWTRGTSPVSVKTMETGAIIIEFSKGEGKTIEKGDRVAAHYSGWLGANLKPFDSSRQRPQPLMFNQGQLIKGWNEGLIGYGKGAKVKLFLPATEAYGERARGQIPANADLLFEVEIMSVEAPPPPPPAEPAATDAANPPEGEKPAEQPK